MHMYVYIPVQPNRLSSLKKTTTQYARISALEGLTGPFLYHHLAHRGQPGAAKKYSSHSTIYRNMEVNMLRL